MYFASLTLSPWESERKPASSNTSAYIIHGSRLIGGVKGPRALVGSPRINGATAATEKYHRLPPLRIRGGIRGAAPRRGASLAKTGAVFAQHPAGGLNERPSIKTAREPNAAPDETPLSEMAPLEYSVRTSKTQCKLGAISAVLKSLFENV